MATSTLRPRAPYDPITSPHLRSAMFERLDKDRFVRAYIQSQKQHTTTYAADGKILVSSWDHQTLGTPTKQKHPTHPSKQYGFDTPVLRARISKPPDALVTVEDYTCDVDKCESEPANNNNKVQSQKSSIQSIKPKEISSKSKKENVPPESANRKTRPALKKRPISTGSDDDDDHVARLTERRERKRAKRAIVHPKELEDDENQNSSPLPEKKTKKAKKSKIPAGLALMHGFTATNVGKNRLTLKPGPGPGVFGKGKASVKTQVVKMKTKKEHKPFSEFAFLNKTVKGKRKQNQAQPNSASLQSEHSSLTSVSSRPTPKLKKIIITNREPKLKARKPSMPQAVKSHRQDSMDGTAAQESSDVVDKSKETSDNSEFEVWDMELDYPNTTHVSCSPASSGGDRPQNGTVVLNTRVIWTGAKPGLVTGDKNVGDHQRIPHSYREEADLAFDDEESGCLHSSSLCPSDSASQYGQPRILHAQILDVPGPRATSKYFVNNEERAEAILPEKFEALPRIGAEEIISQLHYYPVIPLDKAKGVLPIVPSVRSLVTAISNGYQPSQQLVASPSSLDSIEIELREYMDHVIGNADEVTAQFEYPGAIPRVESDVFEVHSGYDDQGESSIGDLQPWPPGGYEDVYRGQPVHPSDLNVYKGLEVEQDTWNGTDSRIDMAGFDFDEEEMQDEDDLDDSEYGSYDPFEEGIEYDITARQDANSSQANGAATSVDDDVRSVLLTQRFSQGRAILLGISAPGMITLEGSSKPVQTVSHAEAVVAKNLRAHWLPQKF